MGDLTNEGAKNDEVSQWGSEKMLSSEVDLFKTIIFNKINHIRRKLPTNQRSFSWRFWRVMWPPIFFWKQNTRNFKDVHVSAENFNGGSEQKLHCYGQSTAFFCIFPAIYTLLTFFLPRRQNRMCDTIFQVKRPEYWTQKLNASEQKLITYLILPHGPYKHLERD